MASAQAADDAAASEAEGRRRPELTVEDVLACSIDHWYSDFRHVTLETRLLPLPAEVRAFLMSDGIVLPPPDAPDCGDVDSSASSEWGDGGPDSDDDSDEQSAPVRFDFPDLEAAVREAITSLGGAVLPKLNWSAPKDAKWLYNTLRCETPHEVFTLLKSSDFVAHDLVHSFDDCVERPAGGKGSFEGVTLALRRWRDMDEAGEFRCFVADGRVRALSQRHASMHWPHLVGDEYRSAVQQHIVAFFNDHICGRFNLRRYVFDVIVGKGPRYRTKLVDFSPWAPSTDALLFDWEELDELASSVAQNETESPAELGEDATKPEFRVVKSDHERIAKVENYHCVPLELVELGSASPDEVERLCGRAEAARAEQERKKAAGAA